MSFQANSLISREAIVPVGSAFFEVEPKKTVRDFTFILLPEFTFLAFAAALDPLRIANQLSQHALYRWSVYSEDGKPVTCSSGVSVNVDGRLEYLNTRSSVFVCSGLVTRQQASPAALAVLRRHARFGGQVGGICTGAITLARAGLLQNRKVTLHWENQPAFREIFPEIDVTSNIFEIDGNTITCGGGSAATDMMLKFIEKDFGLQFSGMVADMCLNGTRRTRGSRQRSSICNQIGSRNPRLVKAIRLMRENLDAPLNMDELAALVKTSRRQIERLFAKHLSTSPLRYYRELRLDHARSLLRETDLTATEIAVASGFTSTTHFYNSFRQRFGVSPKKYQSI